MGTWLQQNLLIHFCQNHPQSEVYVDQNRSAGSYASVNGLALYYEVHGAGRPLILLHGGLGTASMFGEVLPLLAQSCQVIAVDLQGHGRTADIDRPLRYEFMGDDIAALIQQLGLGQAAVMGYSLGAGAALRTAIQHPELVSQLVLVSFAFRRAGNYAEVVAGMMQVSGAAAEFMKPSPVFQEYQRISPDPDRFPQLLDKVGDLLRQDYDWADDVAGLKMPTMLVFGDADSVPPHHAAEFFSLLGGGQRDGGLDGAGITHSRLAVLPGRTHYNICRDLALGTAVLSFLNPA